MTQPQLEASVGEAGREEGGCSQRLGPAPAAGPRDGSRLSPARAAASSQAGAGQALEGAALPVKHVTFPEDPLPASGPTRGDRRGRA